MHRIGGHLTIAHGDCGCSFAMCRCLSNANATHPTTANSRERSCLMNFSNEVTPGCVIVKEVLYNMVGYYYNNLNHAVYTHRTIVRSCAGVTRSDFISPLKSIRSSTTLDSTQCAVLTTALGREAGATSDQATHLAGHATARNGFPHGRVLLEHDTGGVRDR